MSSCWLALSASRIEKAKSSISCQLLRRRFLHHLAHREDAEGGVARLVDLHAADDVAAAAGWSSPWRSCRRCRPPCPRTGVCMPSVFIFQVGASSSMSSRTFSVGSIGCSVPILRCRNFDEHLDVAHLVDHLRAGVELGVHRRAGVGELAAELHRRLLAVQELRHQVRELVPRGLAAGRPRRRPSSVRIDGSSSAPSRGMNHSSRGNGVSTSRCRSRRSTGPSCRARRGCAAPRPRCRTPRSSADRAARRRRAGCAARRPPSRRRSRPPRTRRTARRYSDRIFSVIVPSSVLLARRCAAPTEAVVQQRFDSRPCAGAPRPARTAAGRAARRRTRPRRSGRRSGRSRLCSVCGMLATRNAPLLHALAQQAGRRAEDALDASASAARSSSRAPVSSSSSNSERSSRRAYVGCSPSSVDDACRASGRSAPAASPPAASAARQRALDVVEDAPDDRGVELRLAREVVEQRRLAEPDRLGDLAHADAGEAAAREERLPRRRGSCRVTRFPGCLSCAIPTDRSVDLYRSTGRLSRNFLLHIMFSPHKSRPACQRRSSYDLLARAYAAGISAGEALRARRTAAIATGQRRSCIRRRARWHQRTWRDVGCRGECHDGYDPNPRNHTPDEPGECRRYYQIDLSGDRLVYGDP